MKAILFQYWWLSCITIPLLALGMYVFRMKRNRRLTMGTEGHDSWVNAALFIVILNFGVWGIGTIALHGDAMNGKHENDRYYLARKGHYTEVTPAQYRYSLTHTYLTLASFPVIIGLLGIRDFRRRRSIHSTRQLKS